MSIYNTIDLFGTSINTLKKNAIMVKLSGVNEKRMFNEFSQWDMHLNDGF